MDQNTFIKHATEELLPIQEQHYSMSYILFKHSMAAQFYVYNYIWKASYSTWKDQEHIAFINLLPNSPYLLLLQFWGQYLKEWANCTMAYWGRWSWELCGARGKSGGIPDGCNEFSAIGLGDLGSPGGECGSTVQWIFSYRAGNWKGLKHRNRSWVPHLVMGLLCQKRKASIMG